MMFLLRCAFWLSVVYGAIFWHGGQLRELPLAVAQVQQAATQHATEAAISYCRPNMARCLADAARLTALIDSGASESVPDAVPSQAAVPDRAVPVPVRRPRGVMLTRSP